MALTVTESDGPVTWLSRKKESCFTVFTDFPGVHILSMAPIMMAMLSDWLSKYLRIEHLAFMSHNRLVPAHCCLEGSRKLVTPISVCSVISQLSHPFPIPASMTSMFGHSPGT